MSMQRKGILEWAKAAIEAKAKDPSVVNACLGVLFHDGKLAQLKTLKEAQLSILNSEGSNAYPGIEGVFGEDSNLEALLNIAFDCSISEAPKRTVLSVPALGGTHSLQMAFALTSGNILVREPYWPNYKALADFQGRKLFPLNEEVDSPATILINDPASNPAGYSLSPEDYGELITMLKNAAKTHKVSIIFDPAYMSYSIKGLKNSAKESLFRLVEELPEVDIFCTWSATKQYLEYNDRAGALIYWPSKSSLEAGSQFLKSKLKSAVRSTISQTPSRTQKALLSLHENGNLNSAREELQIIKDALFDRGQYIFERAKELKIPNLGPENYEGGFMFTIPVENADQIAEELSQQGVWLVPIDNKYLRIALSSIEKKEIDRILEAVLEVTELNQ